MSSRDIDVITPLLFANTEFANTELSCKYMLDEDGETSWVMRQCFCVNLFPAMFAAIIIIKKTHTIINLIFQYRYHNPSLLYHYSKPLYHCHLKDL